MSVLPLFKYCRRVWAHLEDLQEQRYQPCTKVYSTIDRQKVEHQTVIYRSTTEATVLQKDVCVCVCVGGGGDERGGSQQTSANEINTYKPRG